MKKFFIGLVLLTAVSCGTNDADIAEIEIVEEEISAEDALMLEEPIERPVYRETETTLTDLIHTKLEVNFVWEKSRMNGVATITAKPHFHASNQLILDAKGMDINSVKMDGKDRPYVYEDDILTIELDKTYTRNDKYIVVIDYVAKPEERESEGSAAITSAKGLYFINPTGEESNKMPQIWTQGETEASSVWFPTIDAPNAKTSQEIFITVEDKYVTLSNGKLMSSKKLPDGKRVDHWKQELPHAPYLFMMGVGEFKIVEDEYIRPDGSKMDVFYYVEPEWESSARDIFGETPEMIRFFSDKMGVEYPWDKYHQIVTRDYVSGAMENTGAVIFGDFVYKNKRELLDGNEQSIIAHELFHHWFGDLVTCESWSNLTLNESFANYSQYLWDEHRYGLDEADYQAEQEAEGYYQSAQVQGYHNLVWFEYDDKEEMFDGHSYNKGGRILHMLRNYLGDDAFFAGMNRYLEQNKFKAAEFHHLRLAFEEVSGEDLNWFFDQWYLGSGHPVLKFRQTVDSVNNTVTVSVEQGQDFDETPLYKLPVNMAIYDNDGKHVHKVVIDEVNEQFTFPFNGEVKGIMYDDQQMLLAKTDEQKTTEQYQFQYYHSDRFAARQDGLMKGSRGRDEAAQQLVLDALSDKFWKIRLLAISKASKLKDARKEKGMELLRNLAVNDPDSGVRKAALNAIGKFLEENELVTIYKDRIEKDPSYSVVTTALIAYGKINPEKAMELAKALEAERSSKMISGLAQLYSKDGDASKYDFFKTALSGNTVQGFDKLGLVNSFTVYIARFDAKMLESSLDVYKDLGENGGFYMTMFLPQYLEYLTGQIELKINSANEEAKAHEDDGNPAYADQSRKEAASLEEVLAKYTSMIEEMAADEDDSFEH